MMDIRSITDKSDGQVSIENPLASGNGPSSHPTPLIQGEGSTISDKSSRGQVVQKSYVLNDTGALKKKLRNETRKEPFNLGVEARDGSNMVIEMKTSFFEHVKAVFIDDLKKKDGIESVDNAVAAKAETESSGTAFVEYSLDIGFKVLDKVFITKLTAYTTSCRVMFQPVGSPPQMKALLGNKSIPRFFVDTYFLPWCEEAYAKKNYDEKQLLEDIKEEIKRLDMIKLEAKKARKEGRLTSISSAEVRCVAKVCKYTGLRSNNKSAVGICAKCGGFEHYECSKTKQETREDIQKGEAQYFCSVCFLKNPSFIAFEASNASKKQISPGLGIIHVTSKVKAIPAPASVLTTLEPEIRYKCGYCDHEAKTNELNKKHEEEMHGTVPQHCPKILEGSSAKEKHLDGVHECDKCNKRFITEDELAKHKLSHTLETENKDQPCSYCPETFVNKDDLEVHREKHHCIRCPLCSMKFTSNSACSVHLKEEHTPSCSTCEENFNSKTDLEEHIENVHTKKMPFECTLCAANFQDLSSLDSHTLSQHEKCKWCEDIFVDKAEYQAHIASKHTVKCPHCSITVNTELQMEEHLSSIHSISCPICSKKFINPQDFSKHFDQQHIFRCEFCDNECESKEDLEKHLQSNHTHICCVCSEEFRTEKQLEVHSKEEHTFSCEVCDETFEVKQKLQDHEEENHSFDCDHCEFKGRTTETMEKHILEKHVHPNANSHFKCDECPYTSKEKEELLKHFKENHKEENHDGPIDTRNTTDSESYEVARLKKELKSLKNNFERIEVLLQDSLEENEKLKSDYESKLIEANNNLRIVKTENEELNEKVEVLFKLGRGYINKYEKKKQGNNPITTEVNAEEIETGHVEEITLNEHDDVGTDDLLEWTKNKLRGFKRSAPTTMAEKLSKTNKVRNSLPPQRPNPPTPEQPQGFQDKNNPNMARPRYCHYYANTGKCSFEERTGSKCKFLHKDAPMCQRGVACTRNKCMYKHPNMAGRYHSFLDRSSGTPQNPGNQNPHPWMMINPWWNPSQVPVPSPWQPNMAMARN